MEENIMNLNGLKHWKSTIYGILIIGYSIFGAGIALLDEDPNTNPNWPDVGAQISAGALLVKAQFPKKGE